MTEQEFTNAGFTVVGTENNENKLLSFLKENYPSVIRDNEINIQELKAIAGLPIDEKVNGYGLNFVGRNFARAKYAQKTEKELSLNTSLSKDIDTTQNLVLKGDNLDSLKILKNYYNGLIKCIYIDPPYNTTSDEFVYPDKFDKEETEVLGLANLSENDFARMDFSFKTKKSHNGWLAFMYPRLLLARDLLSKEGVIFISIDDNEQANLKILCDEVFGEENFVSELCLINNIAGRSDKKHIATGHEYLLMYQKTELLETKGIPLTEEQLDEYRFNDTDGRYRLQGLRKRGSNSKRTDRPNMFYPIYYSPSKKIFSAEKNDLSNSKDIVEIIPKLSDGTDGCWRWGKITFNDKKDFIEIKEVSTRKEFDVFEKVYLLKNGSVATTKLKSYLINSSYTSDSATSEFKEIIKEKVFNSPKPTQLINDLILISTMSNDVILDFFAGSGTTGQAVMQLNAEDGGNRKFILCQIDEPIKEDKPAYQFCVDNNLPTFISSITIERLKRAGEKIAKEIEAENSKPDLFEEDKKQIPDIGFKVFDSIEAPKLSIDESTGQISIIENKIDALSRIYNMIFTVGLDEPTQVPEEVVKDCIYKIGNHHYITNSEKISSDDFSNAIKNGKVFIDGWTASLNGTLQNYKEDVKIVF
ncbi:MAG: site-specific DNA-methyltransferase [Cytophagales bacterium]|nr:MAG: site-specific DNA-methyltransferase [Cytophagales bacterium]